jgi:nitrogenase molybdenum-iron protein alpha/beta subunit
MNAPRCAFQRGMKVFVYNDVASSVYDAGGLHRLVTTEWTALEDVHGEEDRFSALLEQMAARFAERWILASQNISSFVSGFDLAGLTRQIARRVDATLVPIDGPRLDGDWLDGYDEVLARLLPHVVPAADRGGTGGADLLLVGHLLSRTEADERANVSELRRLLAALGLARVDILLSGGPLTPAPAPPAAAALLAHAGPRSAAALATRVPGAPRLPLPLGVRGTVDWLTAIGRLTGREAAAAATIERELAGLLPELQWLAAEHFLGRRVLVVGDRHGAPALVAALAEWGVEVVAAAALSYDPGAAAALGAPPLEPTGAAFAAALDTLRPDVVVGSGAFAYLALQRGVETVEFGFPCYLTHRLAPRPYLGFEGARVLAEGLLNALLRGDERRRGR